MPSRSRRPLTKQRRGIWLAKRRDVALRGREFPPGSEASPVREDRVNWAYMGVKTPEQYRERLTLEEDPFILGELLERAWGTQLRTDEDLARAVSLGDRARMTAVLDPGCPLEEVSSWVSDWSGGRVITKPLDEGYVVYLLGRRHKPVLPQLIASMPQLLAAYGVRGHSYRAQDERNDPFYEVLDDHWTAPLARQCAFALAALEEPAVFQVARFLAEYSFVEQLLQLGLSELPVPALRAVGLSVFDAFPDTDHLGPDLSALVWRMWPAFTGTPSQLVESACEALGVPLPA